MVYARVCVCVVCGRAWVRDYVSVHICLRINVRSASDTRRTRVASQKT